MSTSHTDVTVNIKLSNEVGTAGFGYPLIFTGKLASGGWDYTECSNLEEVVKAIGGTESAARSSDTYKAAQLMWMQNNPPKKIAVLGSTKTAREALAAYLDKGWRHLIVTSLGVTGEDKITDIAAWIETTKKVFFFSTTAYATDGFTTPTYKRTIGMYYADDFTTPSTPTSSIAEPVAALVGAVAGKPAGSVNYKNLIIKGLTPLDISSGDLAAVHEKHLLTIIDQAGDVVTSNGKTANDYYADILDGEDWIITELIYRTQKALNKADKVPYDNVGIAFLENICVGVIKQACEMGIVATVTDDNGNVTGYDYDVRYAPRSETTGAERSARKYTRGTFRFVAAGAIDTVEINGIIEI